MKKLFKFFIGLAMLPLCWSVSRTLFIHLQSIPAEKSGWVSWAIPVGFAIAVLGFFILPKPFRTYVLAHEMTHAVWGLLMGAKVGKMKIGKNGGHVMLSKSNFIISLAPYFFPFYTGLVIAVWFTVGCFCDMSAYEPWWLAAVGLTWGFHVTFTVYMLSQRQPDVLENGRLFSYVIIYLANLVLVGLWMILVGSPTFAAALTNFQSETVAAYKQVWIMTVKIWRYFRPL